MDNNYVIKDFGYFKTKIPENFYFKERKPNFEINNCKINLFECKRPGGCNEIHYYGEQVYSNPAYYEEKKKRIYGTVKSEIIYFEFLTEEDHNTNENEIKDMYPHSAEHYCNNNIHIVIDYDYSPPHNTIPNTYYSCHISSPHEEMKDFKKIALENIKLIDEKILSNIKDEKILSNIALNDENYYVRRDAVAKITDESVLKDVVLNDDNYRVRREAVAKISDESVLKEVILNDENSYVHHEAIKNPNLKDESFLKDIVKNNKDAYVRRVAIGRISDESFLKDIAKKDTDSSICRMAVERISDETILKDIAKNAKTPLVKLYAIQNPNLKDESFLKDIAKNNRNAHLRKAASKRISNKSILNILWKIRYKRKF